MNCDICGRPYHAQRRPFLCAVDARNRLYEPRLAHVAALLQNEQLEKQVEAQLEEGHQRQQSQQTHSTDALHGRAGFEARESERQAILDRAHDVTERARRLRADLDEARRHLDRQRDTNRQRRSDLAAASNGTAARRTRSLDETERSISMTRFRWNRSYDAMAATRGFLCMEAAKLCGLRRLKRGSAVRYEMGGREIVDPYTMGIISTSLGHVTHILMLACHYLSIRLPAEITLPHRDYPRPTVFSLSSSYAHGDVPFPGTAAFQPLPSTANGKGTLSGAARSRMSNNDPFHRMPRARPLYIDKPLAVLAKEDSLTHSMFLEGVALLAYDIAWACGSQGVPIGDKSSLDDVFNIGRNLYNLLIGNQLLSNPAGRIFSAAAAASAPPPTSTTTTANGAPLAPLAAEGGDMASTMGRYSHGTAHTFLGDDLIQGLKLPSPNRLADRLKTKLSSESTLPDWEVLEDDAWAVDDGDAGSGPGGGSERQSMYGVESVATVLTSLEDTLSQTDWMSDRSTRSSRQLPRQRRLQPQPPSQPQSPRQQQQQPQQQHPQNLQHSPPTPNRNSTSGWMKLRNRSLGQTGMQSRPG